MGFWDEVNRVADPLGATTGSKNPIARLHNPFADLAAGRAPGLSELGELVGLAPKPGDKGMNAFLKGVTPGPDKPPDLEGQARDEARTRMIEDARRRRASSALLTGAGGVLDSPATASQILLGL
jgi:hypothetical protein